MIIGLKLILESVHFIFYLLKVLFTYALTSFFYDSRAESAASLCDASVSLALRPGQRNRTSKRGFRAHFGRSTPTSPSIKVTSSPTFSSGVILNLRFIPHHINWTCLSSSCSKSLLPAQQTRLPTQSRKVQYYRAAGLQVKFTSNCGCTFTQAPTSTGDTVVRLLFARYLST